MEWRAHSRRVTLTSCRDEMSANDYARLNKTNKKTTCTFTCQMSCLMCFVLVLVFTLSLVSDVSSFSFTTHT